MVNYIHQAQKRAHPVTKKNIMKTLGEILDKEQSSALGRINYDPDAASREGWWLGFRARHPTIRFRTPESLSTARLNLSVALIKQWYSDVYSYFSESSLNHILAIPKRCFNIDETAYNLHPALGKVLAIAGEKHCFEQVSPHAKVNITMLCAVGADGSI